MTTYRTPVQQSRFEHERYMDRVRELEAENRALREKMQSLQTTLESCIEAQREAAFKAGKG